MQLVPTQGDVIDLLSKTGALRHGHFTCPSGFHTDRYLETALVMRYYHHAKTLSVGLSRLLGADPELRAILPELSIVAATAAGLPVAYGLCESLRARQVYWTEKPSPAEPMRFRQYMEPSPGEKVVLADDILRSGVLVGEARTLLESGGARVLALAALVYQPTPRTPDLGPLPLYYLARLEVSYYADAASCELCKRGAPIERIGRESVGQVLEARAAVGAF